MTNRNLVTANDPLFAPNMIWNYVVVTERINKLGKNELHCSPCVTEDDIKNDIENFLKYSVKNPDAKRGIHYNYAVFTRKLDYVYTGEPLTIEVPVEEAVNKKMRDLSRACLRLAGDEL
jgi:hypothetical protein